MADIIIAKNTYNGIEEITVPKSDGDTAKFIETEQIAFIKEYDWSDDLLPTAIDTDGSIYNGIGYKTGYRLNSSGNEAVSTNSTLTGYIPCTPNDIFRIKATTNAGVYLAQYVWGFDENFTWINSSLVYGIAAKNIDFDLSSRSTRYEVYKEGNPNFVDYDISNIKYVRFSIPQLYANFPFSIHKATRFDA